MSAARPSMTAARYSAGLLGIVEGGFIRFCGMTSRTSTAALLGALALTLAACGGGSTSSGRKGGDEPAPSPADFPAAKGKSMAELKGGLGPGPVLAPTVQQLDPGRQRYGFALFTTARKQISGVPVALYVQKTGSAKTYGPFVARDEQLTVAPPYQSETVAKDP